MAERTNPPRRLERSSSDRVLAGVCGGVAEYFDWDVTLVRVLWVVGSILVLPGAGVLAYVLLWLLAPEQRPPTADAP